MEKVKAKFVCTSVESFAYGKTVNLSVVTGSSEDNRHFAKATPWGEIRIGIDKDVPASKFFVPGEEVYVEFKAIE
jgi:hypothetical protein